jgi:nucleotide-binding universal stress UspA family protein
MTTMTQTESRVEDVAGSTPTAPLVAAVDDSPASWTAIEEAVTLARQFSAPLVFVYVRRGPAGYLGAPSYQRQLTDEMSRARGTLDRARAIAAAAGVEAEGEILEGNPRQRIVEFARDRAAQMVIVGSRRRRLSRSVARAVARAADRPVMVAAPAGSG